MPNDIADALRLFDEDRQRSVTLLREFAANQAIPPAIRFEEARATENAVRQIGLMVWDEEWK